MKSIGSRIGKGSLWISATRGLVNLLGLVSTVFLARLLMPEDFGLVAIGTTMLAIVAAITNLSMAQALVHHSNPTDYHMHTAWTLGVLRGLLIGGLFAASGPAIALFFEDPRVATVMYVMAFGIFLSGLQNPRRIMLQRALVFWQDFVLNVSQKLVGVIVSIVLALLYRSYWALLLGTIAGQLAQVAISYTAMPYRPRFSMRHAKELWSFSMWLTLSQVINTINWRFDTLLLGKFLGRADLGFYTVGNNLAIIPTRETTQPLTKTLFPAFAQIKDDPERLRRAYQRAQGLVTAIALPMGVGVALVAHPLVLLAMGQKWLATVLVIEILASVFALQTLGSIGQPLAMALGHTKLLFRRDCQSFLVRVPVVLIGMYLDGLRGVLIARAIFGTTGIFFNLQIVRSLIGLGFREQLRINARTFGGVIAMVAVVKTVQWLWDSSFREGHEWLLLIISAGCGALTYVGAMLLLWVIAGRPKGAETEVFALLASSRQKIGAMRKAKA